jgi:outer membrane protein OmpA-like peptidoglycan-associated protein
MNKKVKIMDLSLPSFFELKSYLIILLLLITTNSFSQYNENKWIISASFDAVDLFPTGAKIDAPYYPQGEIFEDLFNVSDHWNFGGPSISISKLIYKGLYFGAEMSLNKIKKIEGQDNVDYPYYAGRVFLKKTFYSTKKIRPFIKFGYGVSGIDRGLFGDTIPFSQYFSKTLSPGIGVQFRITDHFGFEISSSFNKAIDINGITHLRHKASIYLGIGDRDKDGDGIINRKDKCPKIPGLPEFNGCPDSDSDGIPDLEDKCPNEPGEKLNEGCPEKDEVLNENKIIPNKNKEIQLEVVSPTFSVNSSNTKEKSDNQVSEDVLGISSSITDKINENRIIYFPAVSTKILGKKNLVKLKSIINLLSKKQDLRVLLQGHSSDDGDSFLNLNLSRDRADSIKRTLIDSGIDPDRIEIKALGEEEPIFDNKSFNGRGFNRCVLITIF